MTSSLGTVGRSQCSAIAGLDAGSSKTFTFHAKASMLAAQPYRAAPSFSDHAPVGTSDCKQCRPHSPNCCSRSRLRFANLLWFCFAVPAGSRFATTQPLKRGGSSKRLVSHHSFPFSISISCQSQCLRVRSLIATRTSSCPSLATASTMPTSRPTSRTRRVHGILCRGRVP